MDIGMDTRYYLDSGNRNLDMDDKFSLDNYNREMDRTYGRQCCLDNHRACIHYPKPNWEDARPVLDPPVVLSKLVLPATWLAIAITR